MDIKALVEKQRSYFLTGATLPVKTRQENLRKLYQAIVTYEDRISEALFADLHKSKYEAYGTEIGLVLDEISHMVKHLPKYAKPEKRSTPLTHLPASTRVYHEPY